MSSKNTRPKNTAPKSTAAIVSPSPSSGRPRRDRRAPAWTNDYFTCACKHQDLRRKRAELRKQAREQAREQQHIRNRALPEEGVAVTAEPEKTPSEIVAGLTSRDLETKSQSVKAAQQLLRGKRLISAMVNAGVINPLVKALSRDFDDCPELQYQAASALTDITAGSHDHIMAVVNAEAIPPLVSLLAKGGALGEQCAWVLGNIASDGAEPRDAILSAGALPLLLPMLTPDMPMSQLRTAVWTYRNFCKNKPIVKFELVSPALPHISELLEVADTDVLANSCLALSYLTDGPYERTEAVQATPRLLGRLERLLRHPSHLVQAPALRAVGNMLTGLDVERDRSLEDGCLEHVKVLLRRGRAMLVKEAAWAASSSALTGTPRKQDQLETIFRRHRVYTKAIEVLNTYFAEQEDEVAQPLTAAEPNE